MCWRRCRFRSQSRRVLRSGVAVERKTGPSRTGPFIHCFMFSPGRPGPAGAERSRNGAKSGESGGPLSRSASVASCAFACDDLARLVFSDRRAQAGHSCRAIHVVSSVPSALLPGPCRLGPGICAVGTPMSMGSHHMGVGSCHADVVAGVRVGWAYPGKRRGWALV
jgi:hypothetical protein